MTIIRNLAGPGKQYPLHIAPDLAAILRIVLTDDGDGRRSVVAYVSERERNNKLIAEAINRMAGRGQPVQRTLYIPVNELDTVAPLQDRQTSSTTAHTDIERRLIAIFRDAVTAGIEDLIFRVQPNEKIIVTGQTNKRLLHAPLDELPIAWYKPLFNTIHSTLGVRGAGQWDENADQAVVITPAALQPYDPELASQVTALRGQFIMSEFGLRLFLRIRSIARSKIRFSLDTIGAEPCQLAALRLLRRYEHGMALWSGETGSGKSTSLFLQIEAEFKESGCVKPIHTIEDPVEVEMPFAINQVSLRGDADAEDRAKQFAPYIMKLLRSAPSIIMPSELRDQPTAAAAAEAAVTGHKIYSTVHAIDAVSTPTRLARTSLAMQDEVVYTPSLFLAAVGQRRLDRLCQHCSEPISKHLNNPLYSDVIARLRNVGEPLDAIRVRGPGCDHCNPPPHVTPPHQLGFDGFVVAIDVFMTDERSLDLLRAGDQPAALRYLHERDEAASIRLLDSALIKMRAGIVDPITVEHVAPILPRSYLTRSSSVTVLPINSAAE